MLFLILYKLDLKNVRMNNFMKYMHLVSCEPSGFDPKFDLLTTAPCFFEPMIRIPVYRVGTRRKWDRLYKGLRTGPGI